MTIIVKLFEMGLGVCALIGPDCETGVAGYGDTAPEALRDLAANLQRYRLNGAVPDLELFLGLPDVPNVDLFSRN
jgi:hypothetical protein